VPPKGAQAPLPVGPVFAAFAISGKVQLAQRPQWQRGSSRWTSSIAIAASKAQG